MRKEELFEVLGKIDGKYVKEAKNNVKKSKNNLFKNLSAIAATIVLMVCSFSVGAFVFAQEVIVEVPKEQETITIDKIGLTMILPDNWKDKYAFEENEYGEYIVYNPSIREEFTREDSEIESGGMLFYIKRWDEQLTEKQTREINGEWNYARNQYIMTTKDGTYLLYYASDVQFTNETMDEYRKMESEISKIRFVVDNVFSE